VSIPKELATKDAKKLLDRFLVENAELEGLNAKLAEFNIFNVLNIQQKEIRHSNTLAWLLNPTESHGLGDRFLKRFLSRLLIENDEVDVSLSPAKVELFDFDDVEVNREWRNIDILVRSPSQKWTLLIENKIKSKESTGQLKRYIQTVRDEYTEDEIIPIFLTLEGDEASEEGIKSGYISLSHIQVLDIISKMYQQYESRIPEDAKVFLRHYIDILRRLTMQDEELLELCKAIYRKHKTAIDLITSYGASSQVVDVCHDVVEKYDETAHCQKTANRVWLVTKDMVKGMEEVDLNGWGVLEKKYPVYWWYHFIKRTGKLKLSLEVGPVADYEKRKALLDVIKDAGFSFWEGGYKEGAKFTRIYSVNKKLTLNEEGDIDDSIEKVGAVAKSLWEKSKEQREKINTLLKNYK